MAADIQLCGLYDVTPTANGRVANFVTAAENLGDGLADEHRLHAERERAPGRGDAPGGFDMRRNRQDICGSLAGNNPAGFGAGGATYLREPDVSRTAARRATRDAVPPDIKFSGSYELPWGVMTSATYQNAAGPSIPAPGPPPTAVVAPALGRNLAAGATATKKLNLIQPQHRVGRPDEPD